MWPQLEARQHLELADRHQEMVDAFYRESTIAGALAVEQEYLAFVDTLPSELLRCLGRLDYFGMQRVDHRVFITTAYAHKSLKTPCTMFLLTPTADPLQPQMAAIKNAKDGQPLIEYCRPEENWVVRVLSPLALLQVEMYMNNAVTKRRVCQPSPDLLTAHLSPGVPMLTDFPDVGSDPTSGWAYTLEDGSAFLDSGNVLAQMDIIPMHDSDGKLLSCEYRARPRATITSTSTSAIVDGPVQTARISFVQSVMQWLTLGCVIMRDADFYRLPSQRVPRV